MPDLNANQDEVITTQGEVSVFGTAIMGKPMSMGAGDFMRYDYEADDPDKIRVTMVGDDGTVVSREMDLDEALCFTAVTFTMSGHKETELDPRNDEDVVPEPDPELEDEHDPTPQERWEVTT